MHNKLRSNLVSLLYKAAGNRRAADKLKALYRSSTPVSRLVLVFPSLVTAEAAHENAGNKDTDNFLVNGR
jgi:predicted protein tyrosine phosphatase